MSNYTHEDAEIMRMQAIVGRALAEVTKNFAQLTPQGMMPTDPVTGAFQNADGSWTETFKAGMKVGSAPVSNRKRLE